MSKKQTRRTFAIEASLYARAAAFAAERGLPMSQFATQCLEAGMRGSFALTPYVPSTTIGRITYAIRCGVSPEDAKRLFGAKP